MRNGYLRMYHRRDLEYNKDFTQLFCNSHEIITVLDNSMSIGQTSEEKVKRTVSIIIKQVLIFVNRSVLTGCTNFDIYTVLKSELKNKATPKTTLKLTKKEQI